MARTSENVFKRNDKFLQYENMSIPITGTLDLGVIEFLILVETFKLMITLN